MSETAGDRPYSGNVVSLPQARRAPPLVDPDTWLTSDVIRASAARLAEIARGLDRLARKWPDLALPVLER